MKVGVVGHVEWVDFVRVERLPRQGEIISAEETWAEAAGGGAVAAVELLRLAGAATLYTALGNDEIGRRAYAQLEALGLQVYAVFRGEPQRRALTYLDQAGERTITLLSRKLVARRTDPLPWEELAGFDGIYFTGGGPGALQAARAARALVATARELQTLMDARVQLDAVVSSATDPGESYRPGDLEPEPALTVWTNGADGGTYALQGEEPRTYSAAPLPGPRADAYGSGDCFAAGLTYGLAKSLPAEEALALAAVRGATAVTRNGAYGGTEGLPSGE
jgi:ribokinase